MLEVKTKLMEHLSDFSESTENRFVRRDFLTTRLLPINDHALFMMYRTLFL